MDSFREGFDFFIDSSIGVVGAGLGAEYVDTVNNEIGNFLKSVSDFEGKNSNVDTLKGDVAEFWHAGTFNINAAARGSVHRAQVDRSHDFGSVDVSGTNFDGEFGLKYYKNGIESARQQSKSVFETYNHYRAQGGKESLDEYLHNRGYQDDSVLNDPVYQGQIRVIPHGQLEDAKEWLQRKISEESGKRSEQVKRYQETLELLKDRVEDEDGNKSLHLADEQAKELARLAKEGNIDPKELGLTTEELIKYEYILKEAFKAGITAAMISVVIKTAPQIVNAVKYLIETGEVDESDFEKIGFSALSGAAEGFVRGTLSAAIITACKTGLCGEALKSINPSVVGAVTVLAVNTIKNAYSVARGRMTRYEMTNELIKTMFTSTCALVFGSVAQGLIEVPVLGYMIGSFVGSLFGAFVYSAAYKPAISFCVDAGFTMFGLVDQDYTLPEDVMKEIGLDVFEYDQFDYEEFETEQFEYKKFEVDRFEPVCIEMVFLRRGVIGINRIGYDV